MHFQKAEILYREGRFQEALVEYQKALEAKHHPNLIFNIAQCYRQLGRWKKALFSYKLFLSERPDAPNRAEVEQRIEEMKEAIARQEAARAKGRVSITSQPAGADVHVDEPTGKPVGRTPIVLSLRRGEHVLFFSMHGYRDVQHVVQVKPGATVTVDVTLPRVAPVTSEGRVSVTTTPPGAEIRVDTAAGSPMGRSPFILRLKQGEHILFLSKPGHRTVQRVVAVKPGAIVAVDVALPSTHPRRSSYSKKASTKSRTNESRGMPRPYYKKAWFKAGVAVTATLSALAIGTASAYYYFYHRDWEQDQRHSIHTRDRLRVMGALADTAIAAAGVSALALTIGVLVAATRKKRGESQRRSTIVAPACSGNACGIVVHGHF